MNISILYELLPLLIKVSSFLHKVIIMLIIRKACKRWLDSVLLSHLKVLSKVLISRPPWKMHLRRLLISSHLMKVRIAHIIFLHILRHSILNRDSCKHIWKSSCCSSIILDHFSLLATALYNKHQSIVHMVEKYEINNANSILLKERLCFPISISKRIAMESNDVFECSPPLSVISGFFRHLCEASKISITTFANIPIMSVSNKLQKFYHQEISYLATISARSNILGSP